MNNWKPLLEKALAKEYPGVTIKWNGDDPVLAIPDELESKANEIIEFTIMLWEAWGGDRRSFNAKTTQHVVLQDETS